LQVERDAVVAAASLGVAAASAAALVVDAGEHRDALRMKVRVVFEFEVWRVVLGRLEGKLESNDEVC
jgi:hypothetical protein